MQIPLLNRGWNKCTTEWRCLKTTSAWAIEIASWYIWSCWVKLIIMLKELLLLLLLLLILLLLSRLIMELFIKISIQWTHYDIYTWRLLVAIMLDMLLLISMLRFSQKSRILWVLLILLRFSRIEHRDLIWYRWINRAIPCEGLLWILFLSLHIEIYSLLLLLLLLIRIMIQTMILKNRITEIRIIKVVSSLLSGYQSSRTWSFTLEWRV